MKMLVAHGPLACRVHTACDTLGSAAKGVRKSANTARRSACATRRPNIRDKGTGYKYDDKYGDSGSINLATEPFRRDRPVLVATAVLGLLSGDAARFEAKTYCFQRHEGGEIPRHHQSP